MFDSSKTIAEFVSATAARTPTPGGGSVTSLVAALAAALGEMVVNYSIGKKGLEAYAGEFKPAVAELSKARTMLLELMVEDQEAFDAYSAAKKLPATDPQRKAKLDEAIIMCVRVPEAIAATTICILECCDRLVSMVNFYLLSDLAVCADLAMAAIRCSIYNVRTNLKLVEDKEQRSAVESTIGQLLSRALILIQSIAPRVWQRDSQGV